MVCLAVESSVLAFLAIALTHLANASAIPSTDNGTFMSLFPRQFAAPPDQWGPHDGKYVCNIEVLHTSLPNFRFPQAYLQPNQLLMYQTDSDIRGINSDRDLSVIPMGDTYLTFYQEPLESQRCKGGFIDMIDTVVQNSKNANKKDLAYRYGGAYRYLVLPNGGTAGRSKLIEQIALWRSKTQQTSPPGGGWWNGISKDINRSRGGDYLYFVWRSSLF